MNSNLKKFIKVIIVFVVIAGAFYFGKDLYEKLNDDSLIGIVETEVYSNIAEVSGKIVELKIEPGMEIKKGEVIAVIDDISFQFSLTQAEANLVKTKEALVGISGNADKNSVESAVSAVKIAESNHENAIIFYDKTKDDFEKNKLLFEAGGLSESQLNNHKLSMEQAFNSLKGAEAQIENAKAALNSVVNGAGGDKIRAAKAAIVASQSQVDQIKDQIKKCKIKSVCDGMVISRNYVLGDFVNPGFDIVDVASLDSKYIKLYYPEDKISSLKFGQEIKFVAGDKTYTGNVSFIDIEKQYTPNDMQTTQNKNKDSFVVKLKFDKSLPLKVGEKVKV